VCFDPNDETSVISVQDWVRRVRNEVPDCHLFGVLMKTDLIPPDDLPGVIEKQKEAHASVGFEQMFPTSSLTRNGVEAVFQAAAELYRKSRPAPAVGQNLAPKNENDGCC
jgi:ethanolamine utilization protein EutP (predicted NTPase)